VGYYVAITAGVICSTG